MNEGNSQDDAIINITNEYDQSLSVLLARWLLQDVMNDITYEKMEENR